MKELGRQESGIKKLITNHKGLYIFNNYFYINLKLYG
jgi:hypothetical protein